MERQTAMPTPNSDSLVSTVKNTSGVEGPFGYIPPHGKRLAPNETITVFGNIADRIAQKGARAVNAFERDLERGDLTVLSTPSPVFNQAGAPKVIADAAGVLGVADPSWVG
jgi:hypothetical protein